MNKIFIKINPVPIKIEKIIKKYVFNSRDFNKPNISTLNYNKINKKTLKSMIILHTQNKIIKNYRKVYKNKKKIYNEYKKNNILDLSVKYNIPPLTIFRIILKVRGFNKNKIKKIISEGIDDPYDNKQLKIAIKNDYYTGTNKEKQLQKSLDYEYKIQKFLDKYNISYYTQDELIKKNSLLTPDFLIKSDLQINNINIYWIDAKNFYGGYTRNNILNLQKQSKKYNNAFGSGAFIFSKNFSEKIKIKNTLLLHI